MPENWKIIKKDEWQYQGVQIDWLKRILTYNPKKYWVRISGVEGSELYIYSLERP